MHRTLTVTIRYRRPRMVLSDQYPCLIIIKGYGVILKTYSSLKIIFLDTTRVFDPHTYYTRLRDFLTHIREIYNYDGAITGTDWLCRPPLTPEPTYDRDITLRNVSRTVMELVDKNSENLPEGDYLKICDELKRIRDL